VDRLRRRQVFGADGYPVAGAVVELDAAVPEHTHDFLEIAVVLAGRVSYLDPSGSHELEVGAVTAVRPGQWHGYDHVDQAVVGNLYLGAELLHRDLRWLLDVAGLGRFLLRGGRAPERLGGPARAAVEAQLRTLQGVRAVPATPGAVSAISLGCAVLGEIAQLHLDGVGPSGEPGDSRSAFTPAVRRLLDLLGGQPARPWTMAALAREVDVSASHLHREFRAQLGSTPMAWLARTRAELAASLLLQTDRPIGWVGRQVGWPEPNYFSRRFRQAYGMSPTAYRERNAPR
jgi:AraC family L-rhamnose operon transcriptional activator RhaR